jgi:hypothetical protein
LAQLGVRETTGFVTVELGKEFGHVSLMSTRYEPEHRAHELCLPEGIRRIRGHPSAISGNQAPLNQRQSSATQCGINLGHLGLISA